MRETEASSLYNELEKMDIRSILEGINAEDRKVPVAVAAQLEAIEALVAVTVKQLKEGGRLFYIGAGTSGRLGVVDASECPPTFGVPYDMVIGIMAGGDSAIRKAAEGAEDSLSNAEIDLKKFQFNATDVLVGIAASGRTPYVIGGLRYANSIGAATGCIVCTSLSPVAAEATYPVQVVTGPEFVTGSTRMKAGTAQKLVLNMLTTAVMIQLGRVKGNRMVDMMLTNEKLVDRGTRMVIEATQLPYAEAEKLLLQEGSVRNAIEAHQKTIKA